MFFKPLKIQINGGANQKDGSRLEAEMVTSTSGFIFIQDNGIMSFGLEKH